MSEKGKALTVAEVCERYGVSESTARRRMAGRKARKALVAYYRTMDSWGEADVARAFRDKDKKK